MTRSISAPAIVLYALVMLTAVPTRAIAGPPITVSGGYSFLRSSESGNASSFPVGWFATAEAPVQGKFSGMVLIGGYYKSDTFTSGTTQIDETWKVHSFMAGPAVSIYGQNSWNISGYVVGGLVIDSTTFGSTSNTEKNFGWGPGVVLDYKLTNKVGLRLGGGVRFVSYAGATATQSQLVAGLKYGF